MDLNCPSCGGATPHHLKYAKLVVCPHCQTALFLQDDAVRNAGERSAIINDPSIFTIGAPFDYCGVTYVPHGRFRFDYGQGFWDEWWVGTNTGEALWVSVDEGDIVMQQPMALKSAPPYDQMNVGRVLTVGSDQLEVTEKNWAKCIGYEGELPEVIAIGEGHGYVHLSGADGLLLTVEYYANQAEIFRGHWIDPFEVVTAGMNNL